MQIQSMETAPHDGTPVLLRGRLICDINDEIEGLHWVVASFRQRDGRGCPMWLRCNPTHGYEMRVQPHIWSPIPSNSAP